MCSFKCHKINSNRGASYIDSPDWIKNKKATINRINKKDNKCFQYTVTVALNYEEIKKDQQRTTKIKSFVDKYNWAEINYPSEKDNWKKFKKNSLTIALNVFYAKKENPYPAYISKHNSKHEKQVIPLLIANGEGWHYLAVIKLSALLKGITSMHDGSFYCLNCLHSFRTKSKLESHKNVCENKDFFNIVMPSEDPKLLEFNQYQKSDKVPFIIHADLECVIQNLDGRKSNPEKSSTAKVGEHIPSEFSFSTILSFKSIENKHDVYRGKDCLKKFCESVGEHIMEIINFKKKKKSY